MPDLLTGLKCWIQCGGAHHSVLTTAVTAQMMMDWAEMMQIECVHITADSTEEASARSCSTTTWTWKLWASDRRDLTCWKN